MRIEAFLRESPMFTVKRAAQHFDRVAAAAFAADAVNHYNSRHALEFESALGRSADGLRRRRRDGQPQRAGDGVRTRRTRVRGRRRDFR